MRVYEFVVLLKIFKCKKFLLHKCITNVVVNIFSLKKFSRRIIWDKVADFCKNLQNHRRSSWIFLRNLGFSIISRSIFELIFDDLRWVSVTAFVFSNYDLPNLSQRSTVILNFFELAVEVGSIRKKYSDLAISSTNLSSNTSKLV
jgi:hypothetical protein